MEQNKQTQGQKFRCMKIIWNMTSEGMVGKWGRETGKRGSQDKVHYEPITAVSKWGSVPLGTFG
jgi:hypothetical protein